MNVLLALSGCIAPPELGPLETGRDIGEVGRADALVRSRILICALGYMTRHGSERAQVEYVSQGAALRLHTADAGLGRHLDHCVGQVAPMSLAGKVIIDSGLPEVNCGRP